MLASIRSTVDAIVAIGVVAVEAVVAGPCAPGGRAEFFPSPHVGSVFPLVVSTMGPPAAVAAPLEIVPECFCRLALPLLVVIGSFSSAPFEQSPAWPHLGAGLQRRRDAPRAHPWVQVSDNLRQASVAAARFRFGLRCAKHAPRGRDRRRRGEIVALGRTEESSDLTSEDLSSLSAGLKRGQARNIGLHRPFGLSSLCLGPSPRYTASSPCAARDGEGLDKDIRAYRRAASCCDRPWWAPLLDAC